MFLLSKVSLAVSEGSKLEDLAYRTMHRLLLLFVAQKEEDLTDIHLGEAIYQFYDSR